VEISVLAHELSFVIVLELRKEDFDRTLAASSFHVRLFIDKYYQQFQVAGCPTASPRSPLLLAPRMT